MAAFDCAPNFFKNRLHLAGRPVFGLLVQRAWSAPMTRVVGASIFRGWNAILWKVHFHTEPAKLKLLKLSVLVQFHQRGIDGVDQLL
jgi:hypothetical protein